MSVMTDMTEEERARLREDAEHGMKWEPRMNGKILTLLDEVDRLTEDNSKLLAAFKREHEWRREAEADLADSDRLAANLREVWGIQHPPSVHVEREYPELRWAEKQMDFQDGPAILVHRFVTEWEPALLSDTAGDDA